MTEPLRYTTFAAEKVILRHLLRDVFRATPSRLAVEIGAHAGYTTMALADECATWGAHLIVVDPWDGNQDQAGQALYETFTQNLQCRLRDDTVIVVRKRSQEWDILSGDVGFIFHDGDHRRDPELERWWDILAPGGVLALHDTADPGWPLMAAHAKAFEPKVGRHEFQYHPTYREEQETYGPGRRGLTWWIKP